MKRSPSSIPPARAASSSTRRSSKPARTVPPSASEQSLLLAAALHDHPLPANWLDALGASDPDVDALLGRAHLVETETGFTLGPALDRDALAKTATWSQRRRTHLALAHASLHPPARFESAAHHFERAGKPDDAARAWLRAADSHGRRHRHAAATRSFCAAFRLLPSDTDDASIVSSLKKLEGCAALGRDLSAAVAQLQDWRDTPPWSERPLVRAETSLVLAALLGASSRHVDSAQARRAAAAELVKLGRAAEAARALLAAAATLAYALQLSLAAETAGHAIRVAREASDTSTLAEAMQLRGFVLGMQGRTAEGRASVEQALALALKHQLTGVAAEAYRLLGSVAEYASCYVDEQAAFAHALAYCRRHDQGVVAGLCLGCLAYSFFRSGNWKRSGETVRRVLSDRDAHPVSRMVAEGVLGLLHAHRGETRLADRLLERSLSGGREMGIVGMDFFSLLGLAVNAEAAGKDAQAAAHHRALLETWRTTEDRHDAIPGLSCAVTFHAERGQRDDAAEFAEALEVVAASTANPEAVGAARAASAELSLLDGDAPAAVASFRSALAAYEQRDLSVELIRVRLRLAAALLKTDAHPDARTLLTDAVRRARRLGARPLAAKAETLLAASRTGSRDAADTVSEKTNSTRTAWDLLSSRQRDIARHLAQGSANKEIAAALGLSVRTVEMHVAGVLARLDCRSRAQAAARIAEELK